MHAVPCIHAYGCVCVCPTFSRLPPPSLRRQPVPSPPRPASAAGHQLVTSRRRPPSLSRTPGTAVRPFLACHPVSNWALCIARPHSNIERQTSCLRRATLPSQSHLTFLHITFLHLTSPKSTYRYCIGRNSPPPIMSYPVILYSFPFYFDLNFSISTLFQTHTQPNWSIFSHSISYYSNIFTHTYRKKLFLYVVDHSI